MSLCGVAERVYVACGCMGVCVPNVDCWMMAQRDASGNQVPNPEKFPEGFAAVTSYIHGLGLKSGLYTSKV